MPYKKTSSLPKRVRSKLPERAKKIFMKAYNSAWKQYDDEGTVNRVAWAAVKKAYKKNAAGKWVKL